jgi:membrane protein DedA with SNARE-associated domain
MGAVRYPLRSFSFFAGLAALSWGLYCSMVGYLGGRAFEDNPVNGVILGIGLALTVTLIVEVVRHQRRKRRTPEPEVEIELATEGEPVG